jgi:hypothetical protein
VRYKDLIAGDEYAAEESERKQREMKNARTKGTAAEMLKTSRELVAQRLAAVSAYGDRAPPTEVPVNDTIAKDMIASVVGGQSATSVVEERMRVTAAQLEGVESEMASFLIGDARSARIFCYERLNNALWNANSNVSVTTPTFYQPNSWPSNDSSLVGNRPEHMHGLLSQRGTSATTAMLAVATPFEQEPTTARESPN